MGNPPDLKHGFISLAGMYESLTADLEAIKAAGIGGIHLFHGQMGEAKAWPGVFRADTMSERKVEQHDFSCGFRVPPSGACVQDAELSGLVDERRVLDFGMVVDSRECFRDNFSVCRRWMHS
jgi:hypothetical protein